MDPKLFIDQLDHSVLDRAISAAEEKTSGTIRIHISDQHRSDALAAAQSQFEKLGMANTPNRNAVLIYFAPRSDSFAIVGDIGIHQKCGDQVWQQSAMAMTAYLKQEKFTEAIAAGVCMVGVILARHFPRDSSDDIAKGE